MVRTRVGLGGDDRRETVGLNSVPYSDTLG